MKKTFEARTAPGRVPDFVRYVFPAAGEGTARGPDTEVSWDDAIREEEINQQDLRSREEGRLEGEERARQSFEADLQKERAAVQAALAAWENDQARYFQQAEAEVVNLALAITRKILQREVTMDTLLLRGAVRVALERVQSATEVRLRVRPDDESGWQALFEGDDTLTPRPDIIADATLEAGQCVLETSLGSTDLGWESQLKDLEQSFQDLMAIKPVNE